MANKETNRKEVRKLYAFRYVARIVLQAESPLAIGSGESDLVTDAVVIRDVNGLPFIPGTALAGVLRHALGKDESDAIFGYQNKSVSKDGIGARLLFTEARMIGKDGKTVLDGLQNLDYSDPFYKSFRYLPIRQHVRIGPKGAAEDGGKFDEEVVYKGTRFCFEVELIGESEEEVTFFKEVLYPKMQDIAFRLGSGTRKGHGKLSIYAFMDRVLDLSKEEDRKDYINKSSSLSDTSFNWKGSDIRNNNVEASEWVTYEVRLNPDDFFLFGSGFGNEEADMTPVKEAVVDYDNPDGISEEYVLIPASSVKGALSHRIAYHYNMAVGCFADKGASKEKGGGVGKDNFAVKTLFGCEGDVKSDTDSSKRGNVLFSDILIEPGAMQEKLLNHVSIDRFTGGAIEGALFTEQTMWAKDLELVLTFYVRNEALLTEKPVKDALEKTLNDLCNGMLPLGGGVNRGNGGFKGVWKIITQNK